MSWNPLKKLSKHGSKSHLLQSDEGDFDKNVAKLDQLENCTKKLYKDAKKYEDLILALNRCEKKMTTDLSNSLLCQEEEKLRTLVEEWHTFTCEMNDIDNELIAVTHRALVEPLKKFQGIFSEAHLQVKRREQSLQECYKCKQKVQKLQEKEKTGSNIVKLESAKQGLINIEDDFKGHDKLLREELPQLYDGRIEYFQPCLEAIIRAQVEHSGELARIFSMSQQCLSQHNKSERELNDLQRQRLANIHALSIVADK